MEPDNAHTRPCICDPEHAAACGATRDLFMRVGPARPRGRDRPHPPIAGAYPHADRTYLPNRPTRRTSPPNGRASQPRSTRTRTDPRDLIGRATPALPIAPQSPSPPTAAAHYPGGGCLRGTARLAVPPEPLQEHPQLVRPGPANLASVIHQRRRQPILRQRRIFVTDSLDQADQVAGIEPLPHRR